MAYAVLPVPHAKHRLTCTVSRHRPRYGHIISSFKAYTRLSNQVDVTKQATQTVPAEPRQCCGMTELGGPQVQYMMTMPTQAQKKFAIRIFQEGQTMVPFGAGGVSCRC